MRFPTATHSTDPQLAEAAENGIEIYRDAVQPKLDEEVLAACLFSRQGLMSNKLAGHFGALPYTLARKRQQIRAGGLPQHFVPAVTAERVYAFEQRVDRATPIGETGEEVARWERGALRVSSKRDRMTGAVLLNVAIESPAGETVHCSVGRSPESEEFVALLASSTLAA